MSVNLEPDLTKEEVAKILKVTPRTVHNYILRGDLKAYRLAGGLRIRPADLEAFRDSLVVQPRKAA